MDVYILSHVYVEIYASCYGIPLFVNGNTTQTVNYIPIVLIVDSLQTNACPSYLSPRLICMSYVMHNSDWIKAGISCGL